MAKTGGALEFVASLVYIVPGQPGLYCKTVSQRLGAGAGAGLYGWVQRSDVNPTLGVVDVLRRH